MKTISTRQEMRIRATEALRAVFAEVPGARVQEIGHPSPGKSSASAFTASVNVYGHPHMLACEIAADDEPDHLRALLNGLCSNGAGEHSATTPLIIARHISDEARALCKESHTGFLDLEGNARIALGDVFILKRAIPHAVKRTVANHATRNSVHHTAA